MPLYPPFLLRHADVTTRKRLGVERDMDELRLSIRIHEANLSTPKLLYFLRTKERKQKKMHKLNTKAVLTSLFAILKPPLSRLITIEMSVRDR